MIPESIRESRKILCCLYLVIMLCILIYTLVMQDEKEVVYWIPVLIIAAVFLFNLYIRTYPVALQWIVSLLCPAAIFFIAEGYTHVLNKMHSGPVFLSLILFYLVFAILFLVTGNARNSIRIMTVFAILVSTVNYFTLQLRSSPLLPWDLYSAGVAMSVMNNFKYSLTLRACNALMAFAAVFAVTRPIKISIRKKKRKLRTCAAAVLAAILLLFCRGLQSESVAERFQFNIYLFNPVAMYRDNGFAVSFIMNLQYVRIEKPEGYSAVAAEKISEDYTGNLQEPVSGKSADRPNIIVVMNEAFSDLGVLGEFQTNMDYMPFIHSLKENTQKGWLYMSVKGGNTANSEFEFLTGSSLYWLPVGSVAYQQYIRKDLPGLADQLGQEGYRTVAMHPYYSSGWNRPKVYSLMHFDEMYFYKDFQNPEIIRSYVSDQTTFDKIEELYEEKDPFERLFVFDVTMQNHGSYYKSFDNFTPDVSVIGGKGAYLSSTEQFLSLIKRSDEAFRNLCEYFSGQDEKTIILMFGDHQPADYVVRSIQQISEDSLEGQQQRYLVPYVMWANYDIEEREGSISSPNYMAIPLLEEAGIPLTGYQKFLKQLSEKIPVITQNAAMDSEGKFYERHDPALESVLFEYSLLQYNDLADTKHRLEHFFTY